MNDALGHESGDGVLRDVAEPDRRRRARRRVGRPARRRRVPRDHVERRRGRPRSPSPAGSSSGIEQLGTTLTRFPLSASIGIAAGYPGGVGRAAAAPRRPGDVPRQGRRPRSLRLRRARSAPRRSSVEARSAVAGPASPTPRTADRRGAPGECGARSTGSSKPPASVEVAGDDLAVLLVGRREPAADRLGREAAIGERATNGAPGRSVRATSANTSTGRIR